MAAITPVQLFPSYEVTGDVISIARADLDNIPVGSLDPNTGNGGVILRGIVFGAFSRYSAIATADRPARWNMARGSQSVSPGLVNALRTPFTFNFDVTSGTFELAQE